MLLSASSSSMADNNKKTRMDATHNEAGYTTTWNEMKIGQQIEMMEIPSIDKKIYH